jgi:hypothetical protein
MKLTKIYFSALVAASILLSGQVFADGGKFHLIKGELCTDAKPEPKCVTSTAGKIKSISLSPSKDFYACKKVFGMKSHEAESEVTSKTDRYAILIVDISKMSVIREINPENERSLWVDKWELKDGVQKLYIAGNQGTAVSHYIYLPVADQLYRQ